MPLVQLEGIYKRYRDVTILSDIDLEIEPGEFVALTGRSGSGKSTLLRIIGGLEPPDRGTVRFGNAEISGFSETQLSQFRRRSMGFVFQSFNLIDTLTIAENIALPLDLNGYARDVMRRRVSELLEALGLSDHAEKYPDTLSGGEQQRAAIARALGHGPELVIADEPTGNLDEHTAKTVMELLVRECSSRGASLIIATHSDEVRVRSDKAVELTAAHLEARA